MCMWNQSALTLHDAEKLNAELHNKFQGGHIRDSANYIEEK
jgi:hypothetical protein